MFDQQFMDYRKKEGAITKKLALQKKVYDNLMEYHPIEAVSIFIENEAQEIQKNPFLYRITEEDADLYTPGQTTTTNGTIIITFQWFNNTEGKKVYTIEEKCYCLFSERELLRIHKDKGISFLFFYF